MKWDIEHDIFQFHVSNLNKPNMKRGVLSTFGSLYDPLGRVCPIVLEVKKILQHLWEVQIGWDELISAVESAKWETWKLELSQLAFIEIP